MASSASRTSATETSANRSAGLQSSTQASPRPRDAATLILLRMSDAAHKHDHSDSCSHAGNPSGSQTDLMRSVRVLMGQRTTRDAWSKLYVFPGGTVDRGDHRVPVASELRPDVADKLTLACSPARARALAVAAIRETFEETGLLLGGHAPAAKYPRQPDPSWRAFQDRGLAPDLADLHFLCRAITPPFRPKRFNARFFLATADHVDDELVGSGELHDLNWFSLEEAHKLPLPLITQTVLRVLEQRLQSGSLETPARTTLFRTIKGNHLKLEE